MNKYAINMNKYVIIYAIAITLVLGLTIKSCNSQRQEKIRLSNNQTALLTDLETYKTKDGKNAAKIIQLELKKGEFEKLYGEQVEKIKDLSIKIKRLEGVISAGTETETGGKTNIRDSIIISYKDSVIIRDSVKAFHWSDRWSEINGIIKKDSVDLKYRGVDTLNIILYRVPKKFLFFKWGTKYIETIITNDNPNTKITYAKSIKISKR